MYKEFLTDVIVIGSGIAGVMAAVKAAENKADVCIVSSSKIFSGSSFYPGTWGFGLIAPENDSDCSDLADTIIDVGCSMADIKLAETLSYSISPAIEKLQSDGLKLKEAENKNEAEFIPCFDHKNRNWHGIVQSEAMSYFERKINDLNIKCFPFTEILDIVKSGDVVSGAIGVNRNNDTILFSAKSVVIASGGMGGLFKYRLNTSDIKSEGQYLALKSGAKLINLEFFQIMPGYISPCPKTIFNEKMFKYSSFVNNGKNIFQNCDDIDAALEIRSTHGPFTSRLLSKIIDINIYNTFLQNNSGITVKYNDEIKQNMPEFVKVYFDWLFENKGLTIDDEIQLGMFFHASNGGVKINEKAETGVDGLFACGEVTGGMHGADRIGGLSTANGIVFGSIAGKNAALYAQNSKRLKACIQTTHYNVENAQKYIDDIRDINFKSAMVVRNEKSLTDAYNKLCSIDEEVDSTKTQIAYPNPETVRLYSAIEISKAMIKSMILRKESRGLHYRSDYKKQQCEYNKKIRTQYYGKSMLVDFEN